ASGQIDCVHEHVQNNATDTAERDNSHGRLARYDGVMKQPQASPVRRAGILAPEPSDVTGVVHQSGSMQSGLMPAGSTPAESMPVAFAGTCIAGSSCNF